MPIIEDAKRNLERLTGHARPGRCDLAGLVRG
jgi:hypothetical protein